MYCFYLMDAWLSTCCFLMFLAVLLVLSTCVLVLFDGCMIVHLLFSHVFGSVIGFVYVWKLSWCMSVLVHCLVLMALLFLFPGSSTKLTFSLWATQNDLMYWFCMVCFTETFNLSHQKKKKRKHFTVGLYCFSPWSVSPAQNFSLGFSIWTLQLTCLLV